MKQLVRGFDVAAIPVPKSRGVCTQHARHVQLDRALGAAELDLFVGEFRNNACEHIAFDAV